MSYVVRGPTRALRVLRVAPKCALPRALREHLATCRTSAKIAQQVIFHLMGTGVCFAQRVLTPIRQDPRLVLLAERANTSKNIPMLLVTMAKVIALPVRSVNTCRTPRMQLPTTLKQIAAFAKQGNTQHQSRQSRVLTASRGNTCQIPQRVRIITTQRPIVSRAVPGHILNLSLLSHARLALAVLIWQMQGPRVLSSTTPFQTVLLARLASTSPIQRRQLRRTTDQLIALFANQELIPALRVQPFALERAPFRVPLELRVTCQTLVSHARQAIFRPVESVAFFVLLAHMLQL